MLCRADDIIDLKKAIGKFEADAREERHDAKSTGGGGGGGRGGKGGPKGGRGGSRGGKGVSIKQLRKSFPATISCKWDHSAQPLHVVTLPSSFPHLSLMNLSA